MAENPLAKALQERNGKLKSDRSTWETMWREIAQYVIPRRLPGLNGSSATPNTADGALLFDTTAVQANLTLANGQLAWMSPQEHPWFAYEPQGDSDDEAKRWLHSATEKTREELAVSPLYTALHEFYIDRSAFGTACLFIEPGKRNAINAQHWPVGTFVIDEDEEGLVDTVIREFHLNARQAVKKFGEANVHEEVRKALGDPQKALEKRCYLHGIYPREDAERDKAKLDDRNMPIASVYLDTVSSHICRQSGFHEMPCMVSRFLEWGTAMNGLYGWAPAFTALPDARQINFLEKMGDALAEKAAFPPVLAPEELEGEVDANANGVTYFSQAMATANGLPREWQTQGRYDILNDRVKRREDAINRAFHVELFQMFAQLDKQMTAREVSERASEKLIQFSPTFSRLVSELFNPMLERVLGIMLRSGRLGAPQDIPQSVFGSPYRIQYSSRLALALRSLPGLGYQRSLERLLALAPIRPDVLDNYNLDRAERDTALADGVPPEFLKSEAEVGEIRAQRAQAQAEAQQQAMALAAVEAGSKVKEGSPMAGALEAAA